MAVRHGVGGSALLGCAVRACGLVSPPRRLELGIKWPAGRPDDKTFWKRTACPIKPTVLFDPEPYTGEHLPG